MTFQKNFPWAYWFYRKITGRFARWLYFALLFLLLIFTTGVRVRTALLTRKIHAVLSGLEQVRVDQTTEEQLLRAVPYLVRRDYERRSGTSVERIYYVSISNKDDWIWIRRTPLYGLMKMPFSSSQAESFAPKVADWLGFRYLSFGVGVVVLDGKVSHIHYGIASQLVYPEQIGNIVSAQSVHGIWGRQQQFSVTSADDESPQYRVREDRIRLDIDYHESLSVHYTFDAPPELTSHAFQVNLSCFWGLRGCLSARQVAPLLWQDKQAISAATEERLKSRDPCTDRVLAGRVRYLPDLNVELLEVKDFRTEDINQEGSHSTEFVTDYRLKEVIHGHSSGPWVGVRRRSSIRLASGEVGDPVSPYHKIGDRVLAFTGEEFDSCQMVPATPSAEAAVRTAIPASRRREDEIMRALQ